jgi:hypothetical protein
MTAIGNSTLLEQPGLKSTQITIHNLRNCDRWSKGTVRSTPHSAQSACFLGRRSEALPATAGNNE